MRHEHAHEATICEKCQNHKAPLQLGADFNVRLVGTALHGAFDVTRMLLQNGSGVLVRDNVEETSLRKLATSVTDSLRFNIYWSMALISMP